MQVPALVGAFSPSHYGVGIAAENLVVDGGLACGGNPKSQADPAPDIS